MQDMPQVFTISANAEPTGWPPRGLFSALTLCARNVGLMRFSHCLRWIDVRLDYIYIYKTQIENEAQK